MGQTAPIDELPDFWRESVSGYHWFPQNAGFSGANVFRLEGDGLPSLFVKQEPVRPYCSVPHEVSRLQWLATAGVSCPRVLRADIGGGYHWLLMTAVPGRDAASREEIDPRIVVEAIADALRDLHARPIAGCPFDHRAARRVEQARLLLEAGEADAADIEAAVEGRSARELLAELEATQPRNEDLVLTHGDACLENILLDAEGQFTGFVDCCRVGVADRYQDLALASRSIAETLGEEWVLPFLERYGIPHPDVARLRFYRLLDEFF